MTVDVEPNLAPPGAGLPAVERHIGRLLLAVQRWTGTRDSFHARFRQERELIQQLVRSCDPASAATRVLIPRPRGLEDSSRYWSVLMTLDHLRIINHSVDKIIGALAKGIVPPGVSSTANVKPSTTVTAAVIPEYEAACDALLATVAAAPQLKTAVRYAHPWFGPLDAWGWYALAGVHMGLHRAQIEQILEHLPAAKK
ncbi:MAG: hypothetical protein JWR69_910 [Pedosphaera sp.]|nr:hypothetical protein [Pedosphaera sp.]